MELESIVLRSARHRKTNTIYVKSKNQNERTNKQTKPKQRLLHTGNKAMVARGEVGEENG